MYCFSPVEPASSHNTCVACRASAVCSPLCPWRLEHVPECRARTMLKEAGVSEPELDDVVFCQIYSKCVEEPGFRDKVMMLTTHEDKLLDVTEENSLVPTVDRFCQIAQRLPVDYDGSLVAKVACAMVINTGELSSKECGHVGFFFDPLFSLINHSCEPNVVVFFEGRQIRLVAQRKIPANAELFVNYCKIEGPQWLRQNNLNRYMFTCNCALCKKKVDRYYSCNCPYCHTQVFGLGGQSTEEVIPVKPGAETRCPSCGREYELTPEQLRDTITAVFHAVLTADEETNTVTYGMRITTDTEYRMNVKVLGQVYATNMIPMYHFPIPVMLDRILKYATAKPKSNPLDVLKLTLLGCFGAHAAAEVSPLLVQVDIYFRELAEVLEDAFRHVEDKANNTVACYEYFFSYESRCTLGQAVLACYLQSYVHRRKVCVSNNNAKLRNKIKAVYASLLSTQNLRNWAKEGMCDGKIRLALKSFSDLMATGYDLSGKIQFADRRHQDICLECDTVTFAELGIKECTEEVAAKREQDFRDMRKKKTPRSATLFPPTHPLF